MKFKLLSALFILGIVVFSFLNPVFACAAEVDIEIEDLDVDPDWICVDEDETIELSITVTLEEGPDDTLVTAKFYVEDDGDWDYIDEDEIRLDEDETRTFRVDYDYDEYDLDEGTYDIKVVVEDEHEHDREIEYSDLYVDDCEDSKLRIDVGWIDIDPEYPDKGDVVLISTPVSLESGRVPETVYVKGYVDAELVRSTSIKFDHLKTKTFEFTVDTDDYGTGPHLIKVKAEVDSERDTATRSFTIGPVGYKKITEHCLLVDSIWVDGLLQPDGRTRVYAKVLNCGTEYEEGVRARLDAFSRTYTTGFFDVPSGGSKDVFLTITVPENVRAKETLRVTVWNDYTTDTWSKDFVIYTGISLIEIDEEFIVENCGKETITFNIMNTGEVSDTFTLSVTGSGAEWVTGIPNAITLNPDDRETITAYISISCETKTGYYEFTIKVENSSKYSATSTIHVVRRWKWPTLTLPTGLFVPGMFAWFPWALFVLLVVFILLLLAGYWLLVDSRRRPMFE